MLINKSFYLGPLFAGLAHVCFNKRCRSRATKPIPSEEPKVTDRTDTWLGWTLGSFLLKQTHPSFQVLAHDTKEQRWGGRVISFTWMANMWRCQKLALLKIVIPRNIEIIIIVFRHKDNFKFQSKTHSQHSKGKVLN